MLAVPPYSRESRSPTTAEFAAILVAGSGDMSVPDRPIDVNDVLPLVYEELRALAARYMCGERAEHTLQPTALVNEAYVRVARNTRMHWRGKTHVFAMAAKEMRRVLIEHARKRDARKRDWGNRITLGSQVAVTPEATVDLIALHEGLKKLSALSPRQSDVAELRFFGGLSERDIARHLGVSVRTVRQDWLVAKAWLARELTH